jgi:hypothetical protein
MPVTQFNVDEVADCAQCHATKPVSEFYVDRSRPRGRVARCKPCYRATQAIDRDERPRRRYLEARGNAGRRGLEWRLTYEQFVVWLWKAPCYYCGDQSQINGIDRLNNEPYYDLTNALACCARCNATKSSLPLHDFLEHVMRIAEHLGLTANAAIALRGAV